MKDIIKAYNSTSLIIRIAVGLVIGAVLGVAFPGMPVLALLGKLFVGALKAIAPVLSSCSSSLHWLSQEKDSIRDSRQSSPSTWSAHWQQL